MSAAVDTEGYRDHVRTWFARHTPSDAWERLDRATPKEEAAFLVEWLQTLASAGFAAPHVSVEWGGGGLSLAQQAVLYQEWARARAPSLEPFAVSLHHVPATLLDAGTDEQKAEFVRDAVSGTFWCQGFSEPDAGSDLASLRTRAVRDGDDYVVTGQKIWSSFAHHARWCLLLARTDPDAAKHKGISYFICDMTSPGVEVRPIRQNTGHAEFNEIFFDDVRIPARRLIGAENDGWTVAQRTLAAERGPFATAIIGEISIGLSLLRRSIEARLRQDQDSFLLDGARAEIVRLLARSEALNSLGLDTLEALETGVDRGDLASVIKVASSDLLRAVTECGSRLAGERDLLEPPAAYRGYFSEHWLLDFVNSWRWSIASGTNEIQRNIIAERVLGLPREPR